MDNRLFVAIQICCVKNTGKFLKNCSDLPIEVINFIAMQLKLSPVLTVLAPTRKATLTNQRQRILAYLGFQKFEGKIVKIFENWVKDLACQGELPDVILPKAQGYLLSNKVILPGVTVIDRMITSICNLIHNEIFESIYQKLSLDLLNNIDQSLNVLENNEQSSYFNQLKDYPPAATAKSINKFIERYNKLHNFSLDEFSDHFIHKRFIEYLFRSAKKYNARDIKRFDKYKRYALMICFLLESRKSLLDHIINMHGQFMLEMCRTSRNIHDKQHKDFRKRHKKAVDFILEVSYFLLDIEEDESISRSELFRCIDEDSLRQSVDDMETFKRIEERGYPDILLRKYPNLRKYFVNFINLPFQASAGSSYLLESIEIIRKLDRGEIKSLPQNVYTGFITKDLLAVLKSDQGKINRNAWEVGLALEMRDKLRSGDLYIPQSKQHISFWEMMIDDLHWQNIKEHAHKELGFPDITQLKKDLINNFNNSASQSYLTWEGNDFACIEDGKLKLKKDDKLIYSAEVVNLQKVIESNLPLIRIEKLLMEVDKITGFTQHFKPIQGHKARPEYFYKTLIAAIISQATNLGVNATSSSVQDVTIDMLRHVLNTYIREETITAASAEIVNHHHNHPLSASQGSGNISSSDAQRFKVRANTLLASHYPRYYGYYEKAIGIYTHVSDQLSVFNTKAISCGPREALYVLDGLLENNTILKIKAHTTDTHGYTEIIFTLFHLLGFYFMPRIRDLKDQQLYRVDKDTSYKEFDLLLTKTVDLNIIIEQWEAMLRVVISIKKRTIAANIIVQRLTSSGPADRLTRAFINFGRIIKTQYILRYLTDCDLRKMVQAQLNKGEYRHKLPRWIFFANQGEFTTGDYEEIMNKASCLSLVSNAILMWNTIKIDKIVQKLEDQGEAVSKETLSHISLLPYKHVLPNGTYFIESDEYLWNKKENKENF